MQAKSFLDDKDMGKNLKNDSRNQNFSEFQTFDWKLKNIYIFK